jgi:hypothetical protein
MFCGEEKQRVDDERGIGLEVEAVAGLIESLGGELVELLVLLLGDAVFVLQPDGLDVVHALAIERDGEADEVRVFAEDALHGAAWRTPSRLP